MIIIFGASGFLGSAIANKLAKSKKVIAVVRPTSNTNRIGASENLQLIVETEDNWPDLIRMHEPSVVICAQWNGINRHVRNDEVLQLSNLDLTIKIAREAHAIQIKKFVALGSQAESRSSHQNIPEEMISTGETSYGKSKFLLHKTLRELFMNSGTNFIWARVFSVYGPGESRDSLIPSILNCNNNDEDFVVLEPNRLWSFLFIDDFTNAFEKILEANTKISVVNIANPELTTVKEICRSLPTSRVIFKNTGQVFSDGYFPETQTLTSLGWRPEVKITDGCNICWEDFRTVHQGSPLGERK